jgi:carboxymethylenebutenolidase
MLDHKDPIEELVHLYVDGAFSRRELMERVSKHAGGWAAAVVALASLGVRTAEAQTTCPADVRVPEGTRGIQTRPVSYAGEGATVLGYLAYPDPVPVEQSPAVIVVHENRGLVEHIKDVTRRVANAGFVALGVDLLSRQGGTDQFTDPVQQQQAYSRTTQFERRSDLISSLDYLKHLDFVRFDRIGTVGFCAGGGNVWDMVLNLPELAAAVAFYGTPTPPLDQLDLIQTPVLAIYAELDRALSMRMADVMSGMLAKQKTLAFRLYEGAGHAFNNDTGPAYNAPAACDAWAQTVAWFNKFLRS